MKSEGAHAHVLHESYESHVTDARHVLYESYALYATCALYVMYVLYALYCKVPLRDVGGLKLPGGCRKLKRLNTEHRRSSRAYEPMHM